MKKETEKKLTDSQKLLLKAIKKMPNEKGVVITTSRDIQDKMSKFGEELSRAWIPKAVRILVAEKYLKKMSSKYFKNTSGQRMVITL